jgi:hypothetical protein
MFPWWIPAMVVSGILVCCGCFLSDKGRRNAVMMNCGCKEVEVEAAIAEIDPEDIVGSAAWIARERRDGRWKPKPQRGDPHATSDSEKLFAGHARDAEENARRKAAWERAQRTSRADAWAAARRMPSALKRGGTPFQLFLQHSMEESKTAAAAGQQHAVGEATFGQQWKGMTDSERSGWELRLRAVHERYARDRQGRKDKRQRNAQRGGAGQCLQGLQRIVPVASSPTSGTPSSSSLPPPPSSSSSSLSKAGALKLRPLRPLQPLKKKCGGRGQGAGRRREPEPAHVPPVGPAVGPAGRARPFEPLKPIPDGSVPGSKWVVAGSAAASAADTQQQV